VFVPHIPHYKKQCIAQSFIFSPNSKRLSMVIVGSIPHGSNIVSGKRQSHADFIPAEIAPMTSKGLLEIIHALQPVASACHKK
jgi:VIT1/CCC1 family predicted Fe2+/Mn2+ transporter